MNTRNLKRSLAFGVTSAVLVTGLTACGGDEDSPNNRAGSKASPEERIVAAFEGLDDKETLGIDMSIDLSEGIATNGGERDLSSEDKEILEKINDSSLKLRMSGDGDKSLEDSWKDNKGDVAFDVITIDGDDVFNMVANPETVYAKLGVKELEDLVGEPLELNELKQSMPEWSDLIDSVEAGDWVSVDISVFEDFAKELQESGGATPSATPSIDSEEFVNSLVTIMESNSKVEEKDDENYVVTLPTAEVLTELFELYGSQLGPEYAEMFDPADIERDIPEGSEIKLDVKLDGDGWLESVKMDMLAAAGEEGASLSGETADLVLEFDNDIDAVEVPKDAYDASDEIKTVIESYSQMLGGSYSGLNDGGATPPYGNGTEELYPEDDTMDQPGSVESAPVTPPSGTNSGSGEYTLEDFEAEYGDIENLDPETIKELEELYATPGTTTP